MQIPFPCLTDCGIQQLAKYKQAFLFLIWHSLTPIRGLTGFPHHKRASVSFLTLSSILLPIQLSVQVRLEMIKRATKALRQLSEKSKKRGGDGCEEQEGTGPAGMTFDEALAHLRQSQAHLDTLSHAFILSLRDSQQVGPICHTLKPL